MSLTRSGALHGARILAEQAASDAQTFVWRAQNDFLLSTPGDVVAQMMSGSMEELLDSFDIKRPTAENDQEGLAMRAELEKLNMAVVCRVFEEKTGYRYLGGDYNTTTSSQKVRYEAFMKSMSLKHEDCFRAFYGTSDVEAEVVCQDRISVSKGPLGEGGYVNLQLVGVLHNSPCDDKGVVTVVYGFVQTGDIIVCNPNLRVCESWGMDNNGMPIMTTDDHTSTLCIKAPDVHFLACGTMWFAVEYEPAHDVPASYFHFSTWRRMMMQFPNLRAAKEAAREQKRALRTYTAASA